MVDTTFVDEVTIIEAPWCNDVNELVYEGTRDLTVAAFTSTGIDDNAIGERLDITDGTMTIGASDTSSYGFERVLDTGSLYIAGGNSNSSGGNIFVYGGTHASLAGDILFGSGVETWMQWDESVGDLEILTGIGSKTSALTISATQLATFTDAVIIQGAFTSLGIDDNATGERLQLTDTILQLGVADTSNYSISRVLNTGSIEIGGAAAGSLGGNAFFYGSSHASTPGDVFFRSGTNTWMQWDESVGDLEILTGIGSKTSALTVGVTQIATFANPPIGLYAAAISGHIRAGNVQRWDGEGVGSTYAIDSNVVEGVYESIGPTGSGADNIWAGMDQLPANATILIANLQILTDTTGTSDGSVEVRMIHGDDASPANQIGNVIMAYGVGSSAANETVSITQQIMIPLGATNQDFHVRYDLVNLDTETILLTYAGFMTE